MKKIPLYLAIVALALIASQCNPIEPDEPDSKPKRDIADKWFLIGFIDDYNDFIFLGLTGDVLEFWPDSSYKVYTDSVLVGEGIYTSYLKSLYPGDELYPFISMTGYGVAYWGLGIHAADLEYSIIHLIGDSVCPPYPVGYSLPEEFWETLHANGIFEDEILALDDDYDNVGPNIFVKLEN